MAAFRPLCGSLLLAVAWGCPCPADELVTPIAVSSLTAANDLYPAGRLIDNSGLDGNPDLSSYTGITHGAASSSTSWVTNAPGGGGSDYYATGSPVPVLTFTLAETHELTDLVVWGYHFGSPNNNEAKDFAVEFSTDGGATWPESTTLAHARTAANGDTLSFATTFAADTVRITITDNHFGTPGAGGGDRIGLGEVKFIGSPPPVLHSVIEVAQIIDFGNLAPGSPPATIPLTVSNLGALGNLQVTASTPAPPFGVTGSPLLVPPGESRDLMVTFDPQGTTGCYFAPLTLTTNDPERPNVAVQLVGSLDCVLPPPGQPDLSPPEGVFTDPFVVTITTSEPGAILIYTTDGSVPDASSGIPYSGPIPVTGSVQIRAAALRAGAVSKPQTKSYLRLAGGLETHSGPLPLVLIDNFGAGSIPNKGWTTGHQTGAGLRQVPYQPAFLHIIDRNPDTGRASITGPPDLTERIGIRVRGAFSSTWDPKPYNLETWTEEDTDKTTTPLGLPGESDWILYYPHPSYDRTMLFNTFTWELSRQTGRYGTRFRFVEVFINEDGGDLTPADRRGVYAFAEKVTRDDDRIEIDKLSTDGTTGGWLLALNRMDPEPVGGFPAENGATSPQFFHTAGPNRIQETPPNTSGSGDDIPRQYNAFLNFDDPKGYKINPSQRAAIEDWFRNFEDVFYNDALWRDPVIGYRKYLNTRDFIDYFHLLNLAKQGDGLLLSVFPWVSTNPRQLHMGPMWDFNNGAYSSSTDSPLYFRADRLWYPRLFSDPDYLRESIDRWYELRRGPLATSNMHAIVDAQAAEITDGLAAAQGISVSTWHSRLASMKSYLTNRAGWLDDQFFKPPTFSHPGGVVSSQFSLTITNATGTPGTIFFTVDGSDPIDGGGNAYTGPVAFNATARVKARIQATNGDWSALNEASYVTGTPAGAGELALSEIMYHPLGDPEGEFLELLNINPSETLDLALVRFAAGVEFTFPVGTVLAPGERILVVRNTSVFETIYGTGHSIAGEFQLAGALDNSGDHLILETADGSTILDFSYNDKHPWPTTPDGGGDSLVLIAPFSEPDHGNPINWRSSTAPDGNPGASDSDNFSGNPEDDFDRDGIPALVEHALGSSDQLFTDQASILTWVHDPATGIDLRVSRSLAAEDTSLGIEVSDDLLVWSALAAPHTLEAHLPQGLARFHWHLPAPQPPGRYFRLRASMP